MSVHVAVAPPKAFPTDLANRHRHDLRVVYAQADPGDTSPGTAAMTVLESLGKSPEVTGGKEGPHDNVSWRPIWMRAHQVEWLILADPQVYRPAILTGLLRVIAGTPANVLLATRRSMTSENEHVLDGLAAHPVSWEEIPALLPAPNPVRKHPSARITPPPSDWITYRADCRDLLPRGQRNLLDRHYRETLAATTKWLDRNSPDEAKTQALLAQAAAQSGSLAEALTRVRASQAAFFSRGWNLRISTPHLMRALAASVNARFSDDDWSALRAYRPPYRPALVALHQAGLPLGDLMALTVTDVAEAIATGHLGAYRLAAPAVPFLTAQLLQRATEHARGPDPFVVGAARTPGDVINAAARDLGLLIGVHHTSTNQHTMNFWQFRAGLQLSPL